MAMYLHGKEMVYKHYRFPRQILIHMESCKGNKGIFRWKLNNKINNLHEKVLRLIYKDKQLTFEELLIRDKLVIAYYKILQILAIEMYKVQYGIWNCPCFFLSVFPFNEHQRFIGHQEKGKATSLTPLYLFHQLHRHLDISQTITAESSSLHIFSSRTQTGNLWFPSANR